MSNLEPVHNASRELRDANAVKNINPDGIVALAIRPLVCTTKLHLHAMIHYECAFAVCAAQPAQQHGMYV